MMQDFYSSVQTLFHDWNYSHPRILHGFVCALKPQIVVEVGCYRALTACWIGRALQENNTGKLICLDNWSLKEHVDRYGDPRAHAEFNLRTCGVDGWVELRTGDSGDPGLWPGSVDLCYVDGWHSYLQCKSDFSMAAERGAKLIALDDTENCVGPRMFAEQMWLENNKFYAEWDVMDIHSDNGLTLFLRRQERRPITFSQELPPPCVGVDLRPLTLEQQAEHFAKASAITQLDYSSVLLSTEHDLVV